VKDRSKAVYSIMKKVKTL